jgi:hypothetical protein
MHIIGPLLVVALIGLVILIVVSARRQRAAGRGHFVEAARAANLAYLEEDDGTAESLAQGFDPDEFARFSSPSLGPVRPQNVVHGSVAEGQACLFSHSTRHSEGDAREWFLAIVDTAITLNSRGLVKCRSRDLRRVTEIGGLPEVEIPDDPDFNVAFRTQAEDVGSARQCLVDRARREILDALLPLGYPLDLQIVGSCVALYPADRNYSPESAQDLNDLLIAARRVAGALAEGAAAD